MSKKWKAAGDQDALEVLTAAIDRFYHWAGVLRHLRRASTCADALARDLARYGGEEADRPAWYGCPLSPAQVAALARSAGRQAGGLAEEIAGTAPPIILALARQSDEDWGGC